MDRQQIIDGEIAKLPIELKTFIANSGWLEKVRHAGQTVDLTVEQLSQLEDEVLLVIIGLSLESDFAQNLQDNVGISEVEARSLTDTLWDEVFTPIEQYLPVEEEPETNPDRILEQPHDLIASSNTNIETEAPYNLSTGTPLEEKISANIGSPTGKAAWEERKGKIADTIVTGSKYGGLDPYREVL